MHASTDRTIRRDRAAFKRITIAWQDLADARDSLNRLLGLNNLTPPPIDDKTVRQALVTAAVVSYGRLFTRSRASEGVPSCLSKDFEESLTEEELRLHARILMLRSKEFAHSDAEVAEVEVVARPDQFGGMLMPTSRQLRAYSLSESELRGLDGLCSKVHIYLYDEMMAHYQVLSPHGNF